MEKVDMTTQHRRGFYVQETTLDVTPAMEHVDEIVPIFGPNRNLVYNSTEAIRTARNKLHDFGEQDAIIPLGDPIAIAMVAVIAAEMNNDRFKVLKWEKFLRNADGFPGRYILVQVDLRPERVRQIT